MNAIILAVIITGPIPSTSFERFETADACHAVGGWMRAEHYAKSEDRRQNFAYKCFKSDFVNPPAKPAE